MEKKILLLLVCALLMGVGCKKENRGSGGGSIDNPADNGNDFNLFNKVTVEVSLPAGTQVLLYTQNPVNEANVAVNPVMIAYSPFTKELRIPKAVNKLYFYANGMIKEFPNEDISVSSMVSAKNAPVTRSGSQSNEDPGSVTQLTFTDEFLTAINACFPEWELNVSADQRRLCTDMVIPEGENTKVWVTYVHNGGTPFDGNLWYYTYTVDIYSSDGAGNYMPKKTISQINQDKVLLFENANPDNSSGKRIYLGEFEPGTRIGFIYTGLYGPRYSTPFYNYITYGEEYLISSGVIRTWTYEGKEYATLGVENAFPDQPQSWDGDHNDMICLIETNEKMEVEHEIDPPLPPAEMTAWAGYWLFEDNYPYEGDYDFNDLVVKYSITESIDVATIDLVFLARGASYSNSFGVNGSLYFDNLDGFINVYDHDAVTPFDTLQLTVPVAESYIPMMYNTMDTFDLNTFNEHNLDFPNVFDIPVIDGSEFNWCLESVRIDNAYSRYKDWVDSKCTTNVDWYLDDPKPGTVWNKLSDSK